MKKILAILLILMLVVSCGQAKDEKKEEKSKYGENIIISGETDKEVPGIGKIKINARLYATDKDQKVLVQELKNSIQLDKNIEKNKLDELKKNLEKVHDSYNKLDGVQHEFSIEKNVIKENILVNFEKAKLDELTKVGLLHNPENKKVTKVDLKKSIENFKALGLKLKVEKDGRKDKKEDLIK